MILNIGIAVIGAFIYLFTIWRRLKDDYVVSHLFTTGFSSLFGMSLGIIAAAYLRLNLWFWIGFFGLILGLIISSLRFHLRFYEVFETAVIGILPLYLIFMLKELIFGFGVGKLMVVLVTGLIIVLFKLLDTNYRSFSWYPSGKPGFAGLTILGLFAVVKSLVAIYFPDMVSFSGKIDVYISCVILVFCLGSLLSLSRLKV